MDINDFLNASEEELRELSEHFAKTSKVANILLETINKITSEINSEELNNLIDGITSFTAKSIGKLYYCLLAQGFTKDQSFELTKLWVSKFTMPNIK